MGETIGRIIETVIDFCRQNSSILMITGGILILIIIIGAVIISAKKGDKDDDLDFDERNFTENKETINHAAGLSKTGEEDKHGSTDESKTDGNTDISSGAENSHDKANNGIHQIKTEETVKSDQLFEDCCSGKDKESRNSEIYIKKADTSESIESLLHEAAGLLAASLDEVEINIQGAQVKIKYSKKTTDEPGSSSDNTDCTGGTEDKTVKNHIITDDMCEETAESNMGKETLHADIKDEPDGVPAGNCPSAGRIKFGPDNLNKSRSGKVFTEKELMEIIKD